MWKLLLFNPINIFIFPRTLITMENDDLKLAAVDESVRRIISWSINGKGHSNQFLPTISVVSHTLRNLSPSSFEPRVALIGPLQGRYRHAERTRSYVKSLMECIPSTYEETFKHCVQKVYAKLEEIKACYVLDQIDRIDDDEFAETIVMDAFLILGFVNQISKYNKSYRGNMLPDQTVIYDLVLLENQIPFFILDQIFQCTILKFMPKITLVKFLHPLLNLLNIFKADIKIDHISTRSTNDHILSLLYECYKPQDDMPSGFLTSIIHSTKDLDMVGFKLKPNRNPKWIMGMHVKLHRFPSFSWCWRKPTLRIPVLYVHDFTELVLRNLIAYEHQSRQPRKYITSYAYAMDMLVNTPEDLATLVDSGVLVNNMGSNEEAVTMINRICKRVAREHFFYGEEWKNLDEYCSGYWKKNIARLKRNYFNSPWNIIALFAGIILFALTVVQTIFTIKSI